MSHETWIVQTNAVKPETVARHRSRDGRLTCAGGSRPLRGIGGIHRELAPEEIPGHRPSGDCIWPEHDGPLEAAGEAAASSRAAAASVAEAALTLCAAAAPPARSEAPRPPRRSSAAGED
jgi:hypothetical protein